MGKLKKNQLKKSTDNFINALKEGIIQDNEERKLVDEARSKKGTKLTNEEIGKLK